MSLGKGIALAGMWFGAGIGTIGLAFALDLSELIANESIKSEHIERTMLLFVAPFVIVGIITFFMIMFDAMNSD